MTPEQAELLELAKDNVRASELLLQNGFAGFAASRAYYAMFAAAEALLLARDLTFSKHSAVIAAFGRHFAKPGIVPVELHRAMLAAQRARQAADYGDVKQVTSEEASGHIDSAKELLRCAESVLAQPNKKPGR